MMVYKCRCGLGQWFADVVWDIGNQSWCTYLLVSLDTEVYAFTHVSVCWFANADVAWHNGACDRALWPLPTLVATAMSP